MGNWAQYYIPATAAIGTAMYGIDTGIIATTIGHQSFNDHMFPPDGEDAALIGKPHLPATPTRLSNLIYTLTIASAIAIVGILLSVIGTNVGMFITGRLLTGWSSGMILPVSAIYMAEVSKPKNRGIVVGFQGMGTATGFFLANWIGYSGIFFEGNLQWMFPLSLQFPCAVLMLIGSLVILPFTPRWLVSQDRFEEARAVLARIHSDEGEEFIDQEMIQIREQTALERSYGRVGGEKWYSNFLMLFTKQYIKRLGFVCFIQALTQFGGVTVIQNYQNIFWHYRWRRTTTLWVGCLVLAIMLAICEALSAQFSDGSNQAASRTTIAFIFLYSAFFAIFFNSTMWVVSSELLPVFIRSSGLAVGTFASGVASIVISQITPVALENISWRYYNVFIAANLFGTVVYLFFLPDTKGKTLEEIGELFGDTLATAHIGDIDVDGKQGAGAIEPENASYTSSRDV
ncbi:hypothetical protein FJTKL_08787 [Diaporthe vaccinii]|uniref:Major facilitator superfamily (MFS) profile domain-containing protein n=1 Tax=Diaporthe vaccinii TaxID=105482 RepID=A0ABR4EQK2_9PEZI